MHEEGGRGRETVRERERENERAEVKLSELLAGAGNSCCCGRIDAIKS